MALYLSQLSYSALAYYGFTFSNIPLGSVFRKPMACSWAQQIDPRGLGILLSTSVICMCVSMRPFAMPMYFSIANMCWWHRLWYSFDTFWLGGNNGFTIGCHERNAFRYMLWCLYWERRLEKRGYDTIRNEHFGTYHSSYLTLVLTRTYSCLRLYMHVSTQGSGGESVCLSRLKVQP